MAGKFLRSDTLLVGPFKALTNLMTQAASQGRLCHPSVSSPAVVRSPLPFVALIYINALSTGRASSCGTPHRPLQEDERQP